MAEIDAVDGDELAELAAALLPAERLAAAGVGSDETKFRSAVGRASSSLVTEAESIAGQAGDARPKTATPTASRGAAA
jgi:hypothetical protein